MVQICEIPVRGQVFQCSPLSLAQSARSDFHVFHFRTRILLYFVYLFFFLLFWHSSCSVSLYSVMYLNCCFLLYSYCLCISISFVTTSLYYCFFLLLCYRTIFSLFISCKHSFNISSSDSRLIFSSSAVDFLPAFTYHLQPVLYFPVSYLCSMLHNTFNYRVKLVDFVSGCILDI